MTTSTFLKTTIHLEHLDTLQLNTGEGPRYWRTTVFVLAVIEFKKPRHDNIVHWISELLTPSMATNGLPISLYEDLLPKLVAVLELTQQTVGISTPQAKQKLLQTVCYHQYDFSSIKLTEEIHNRPRTLKMLLLRRRTLQLIYQAESF